MRVRRGRGHTRPAADMRAHLLISHSDHFRQDKLSKTHTSQVFPMQALRSESELQTLGNVRCSHGLGWKRMASMETSLMHCDAEDGGRCATKITFMVMNEASSKSSACFKLANLMRVLDVRMQANLRYQAL